MCRFHSAGISSRNVTLGLPRLEELMKATRQIKTPSMTMYLTSAERRRDPLEEADRARLLANRMQFTRVGDLVKEWTVVCDPLPGTKIQRDKCFVEQWYATEPPPHELLSDWVVRLVLNRDAMSEREYSVTQLAMSLRQSFTTAEQRYIYVVSSDDNDYQNEDGGIVLLRLFQHVLDKVNVEMPTKDSMADPTVLDNCTEEQWIERTYSTFAQHVAQFAMKLYVGGIENVSKVSARQVTTVVYDRHTGNERKDCKEWVLDTDGSNMLGVMALAGIDGRRVLSNNPVEIAAVLGVEVARQVLLNEMRAVLSFYGLYVNYRHLSLLCDFMTHFGSVRAISRHTLNKRRTGPLMRCTFEEPVDTLCDAGLFSEFDRLDSVSQCVMFGKPMPYGTGIVHLLNDDDGMEMMPIPKQLHFQPPASFSSFEKSKSEWNKQNAIDDARMTYLQQINLANPFTQLEQGGKEEGEEKGVLPSGRLANITNPFEEEAEEEVGKKRAREGEEDDYSSRIVSHNPFAKDMPVLVDSVVEKHVPTVQKLEEKKLKEKNAIDLTMIYCPSTPKRLHAKEEEKVQEEEEKKGEEEEKAEKGGAIDLNLYFIPSSPKRK